MTTFVTDIYEGSVNSAQQGYSYFQQTINVNT
jgi:hypothetical protein